MAPDLLGSELLSRFGAKMVAKEGKFCTHVRFLGVLFVFFPKAWFPAYRVLTSPLRITKVLPALEVTIAYAYAYAYGFPVGCCPPSKLRAYAYQCAYAYGFPVGVSPPSKLRA